jgi:hypothetical protein
MEVCTKVVDGISPLEQISTTWSDAQKGTSHQRSMHLLNCAFLTKACDRIIVSPVGTGKISLEVARCHLRIAFYRAADLVRTLTEARRENAHLAVSPLEKGRSDSRRAGGRLIPESRRREPLRSAFRAQRDTSYTRNQWSVRDLLTAGCDDAAPSSLKA